MRTSVGIRMVTAIGTLLALGVWLRGLGQGRLATPPIRSRSAIAAWYDRIGPEVAAMAALRLLALGLVLWLLASLALQALAAIPTLQLLRPLADLISPRSLQRLGQGLAGLSLTAGLAVPAPSAGFIAGDGEPAPATTIASDASAEGADEGLARMSLEPGPSEQTPGNAPEPAAPPTPPVASSPTAAEAQLADPGSVLVEAGDSFWSIAAEEVGAEGSADEHAIASYWVRLIEANRARLVDPANPDLIYPGQVLTLP